MSLIETKQMVNKIYNLKNVIYFCMRIHLIASTIVNNISSYSISLRMIFRGQLLHPCALPLLYKLIEGIL